jgi:SAM-dependent methyltransferase
VSREFIDPDAFHRFEVSGWERVPDAYHRFFGPITGRVIDPLLEDARVGRGARVLDIATGPGYVAARARQRGASVVGIDIATQMVALARRRCPEIEFRHGNAEELPFPDASFHAAVGNFVLLHLGRPERAAAECVRVVASGGRVAFSVWDVPERARLFGVFVDAMQAADAPPPPDIPPGPPFFRFSSDQELSTLLRCAGLEDVSVRCVTFAHRVAGPEELWRGVIEGGVRTPALILRQSADTQRRIRSAFERLVEPYAVQGGLEVPVSIKLASGRKPAA